MGEHVLPSSRCAGLDSLHLAWVRGETCRKVERVSDVSFGNTRRKALGAHSSFPF